jgi:archaellum component FlaC
MNSGVNVQNQLNATDAALAALSAQIVKVTQNVSATQGELKSQISATNTTMAALSADLGILDSKLDSTSRDVNATTKTLGNFSSLITNLNSALTTTQGNLQGQINATSKTIGNLSTLVSNFNTDLGTTRGDLQSTSVTVTTLSANLGNVSNKVETTREDLQSQLNATKKTLGNFSTLISNVNVDLNTTKWSLQNQINGINQTVQLMKLACFSSCKQAYSSGLTTSGVYQLCPNGLSSAAFSAYCDQTTDGGGWMLFFAYNHVGGENKPLQLNTTPPISPTNGYSHINLNSVGYNSTTTLQDLRFYCETSMHSKKLHFKVSNALIKNIAISGSQSGNTPPAWNSGYTLFGDHSASLPALATYANNDNAVGGLWFYPFFNPANYHWSVGAETRWECDDWAAGPAYSTRHNIWARIA